MNTKAQANTISILGCGWLGLPLGAALVQQGYAVKGSVTQHERMALLAEKGIVPFEVMITDKEIIATDMKGFLQSDILIINIPPSRRPDILLYHQAQMTLLVEQIKSSSVKHVLFVSSTSVYPDVNGEVYEHEVAPPAKDSGKALLAVEKLLRTSIEFMTTVVRFAGLIGYDRLPGRFLAGKKDVENGDAPINVIHQDDCVALMIGIIKQQAWGDVFNACADEHPRRRDFYTKAALNAGLEPPTFALTTDPHFKIIIADKIKQRLDYTFKYPDPMTLA